MTDTPLLDPNDPFDAALIPMVLTNRAKRRDYAVDGDPFSNFAATADGLGLAGFGARESALFNVLQKVARLKALRENGRMEDTANEAVEDTYLDLAVYSVILLAIVRQENAKAAEFEDLKAAKAAHFRRMQDGINGAVKRADEVMAKMAPATFYPDPPRPTPFVDDAMASINGETPENLLRRSAISLGVDAADKKALAEQVERNIANMRRSYERGIN